MKEGGVGQDKCEIDVRGVEGRAVMAGVGSDVWLITR